MKILIDADGCPVVNETIYLANKYDIDCYILCDTSHFFERKGAKTLTFSKGADSVDFALVNKVNKGDIVITQDYGLAAMVLAKKGYVLDQNGREYTEQNIDILLHTRHLAKKARNRGERLSGPKKRTKEQDIYFSQNLEKLIKKKERKNNLPFFLF